MKCSISAVLLILSAAACFAADIPTPTPGVVKLLPASGDVKGWNVQSGTLVYAVGEKLTEIYDGGYELYTKAGVQEAAQQIYRHKRGAKYDIATVTVHLLDTMGDAKKFYKYWEATDKKQPTYKKLTYLSEAYVYTANDAASGYLFRYRYFVTVEVDVAGAEGKASAMAFLKSVSSGYWKVAGR